MSEPCPSCGLTESDRGRDHVAGGTLNRQACIDDLMNLVARLKQQATDAHNEIDNFFFPERGSGVAKTVGASTLTVAGRIELLREHIGDREDGFKEIVRLMSTHSAHEAIERLRRRPLLCTLYREVTGG